MFLPFFPYVRNFLFFSFWISREILFDDFWNEIKRLYAMIEESINDTYLNVLQRQMFASKIGVLGISNYSMIVEHGQKRS